MWFTSPSTPIQGVGVDKDCTSQFVMTNTIKYCTTLHYTAQSLQNWTHTTWSQISHSKAVRMPKSFTYDHVFGCSDSQEAQDFVHRWTVFCEFSPWYNKVTRCDKMWQDVTSASTCFGCTGCINLVDLSVLSRQSLRPSVSTFWTMPWTRASVLTCLTKARILLPFWIFWSLFSSLFIPFLYFSLFLSISLYFSQFLANELFPTPFF